jgi:protein phosphatase
MNPSLPPSPAIPASFRWSGGTDRGKIRTNNEDAFLGLQFDTREIHRLGKRGEGALGEKDFVFAVSDGMGGAKAGEFASRIAIEKITTLLPRASGRSAGDPSPDFAAVLMELYAQIHRALQFVGGSYEECRGMETTLSLCWFMPGWMRFAHIGDSRIYHLRAKGDALQQLTHDDTHVGWLLRSWQITARQARMHPRRNVLQKALGGDNQFVDPQVGAVACEPGDTFLLCTDGLVEGLDEGQLLELLRGADDGKPATLPAQRLVEAAVEKSGRDNTTALVIQFH